MWTLTTISFFFYSEKVHNTRSEVESDLRCVVATFNQVGILNERNTVPVPIAGTRHSTTEEHRWATPLHFCDCLTREWAKRGDSFRNFKTTLNRPLCETAITMGTDEFCTIRMPADTFNLLRLIRWLDTEGGLHTTSLMIPQNNQTFLVANQDLFNKKNTREMKVKWRLEILIQNSYSLSLIQNSNRNARASLMFFYKKDKIFAAVDK